MRLLEQILSALAGIFNASAAKEKARADLLEAQLEACRKAGGRYAEAIRELEAALEIERRWRRNGASAGDRADDVLGGKPGSE